MDRLIRLSLKPRGALVRQVGDVHKSLVDDGYEVVAMGSRVSVVGFRGSCGGIRPLSRSEAQKCLSTYRRFEVVGREFEDRLLVELIASYQ